MSNQVKFKRSLFGIKKKPVEEYINSVSRSIEDKLFKKDTEITSLKKDIEVLKAEKARLEKEVADFQEEKGKISEVFLKAEETAKETVAKAEKKAEEIIEEADKKAKETIDMMEKEKERLSKEFEAKINLKKTELSSYKSEINYLREKITLTLNKFDEILKNSIQ